jgi:XTP/dITP diphosphohydrolase
MRLVLASNNPKKLAELRALFAGVPVDLMAQGALGIDEAEEPHLTFVENALAKARHAAQAAGCAALADDSGLCVDALGGAPGVASAHYAVLAAPPAEREALRAAQDAANNRRLLDELAGITDRRASFVCTLVALRHAADPQPLIAVGRWDAQVLPAPRGSGGFGYDPLVFVAAFGCSVAELSAAQKNAHSHRAIATQSMLALIRSQWLAQT